MFRDLLRGDVDSSGVPRRLEVEPRKGRALLFFPSSQNGKSDDRTLHAGAPAEEDKWIAQLWVHAGRYDPAVPAGTCQKVGAKLARKYAEYNALPGAHLN